MVILPKILGLSRSSKTQSDPDRKFRDFAAKSSTKKNDEIFDPGYPGFPLSHSLINHYSIYIPFISINYRDMMGYLLTIDMINYRYIYGDMMIIMGYVGYITCICIPLPSGKHTKNKENTIL